MSLARDFLAKSEDPTIVLNLNLDNTALAVEGFEDWNCGDIENCGVNNDVVINNNSLVRISNQEVRHAGEVITALSSGAQILKSIGAPLTDENIVEIGRAEIPFNFDIANTLKLQNRDFQGRLYSIDVGGKVGNTQISFSAYHSLVQGKIKDMTHDSDVLTVTIDTLPVEYLNEFPLNTYRGTGGRQGDEDNLGRTKPYAVGFVENATPVDLGNGLYQFHDGTGAVATEVFDQGVNLTLVEGNPFTGDPAIGEYMTNTTGFIKVHIETDQLTCHIQGALIGGGFDARADKILSHITTRATAGRRKLNDLGGDWEMGYYFTTRRPIIEYVREIATNLDYYIIHEDNGDLSLKKRYNGNRTDFQGNLNEINTFSFDGSNIIEDTINGLGTSPRYTNYNVGYRQNWTPLRRTELPPEKRREFSREGLLARESSTLTIEDGVRENTREWQSNLRHKNDADKLASLVYRESLRRRKYEFEVENYRWLLMPGMVGTIDHPIIRSGLFEIASVNDDTDTEELTTKVTGYLL